jgi:hypothetical protein
MLWAVSTRLPERIASNPGRVFGSCPLLFATPGKGVASKTGGGRGAFAHDANRRPVPSLDADKALG